MAKKKEDEYNYGFLLNCLTAITTTAALVAGITLIALKAHAASSLIPAANLALASSMLFSFSSILPMVIFGAAAAVILISICSSLCKGNGGSSVVVSTAPTGYGYGFSSTSTPAFFPGNTSGSYVLSTSHHSHPGTGSNTHGHAGGGISGGTIHSHTGGGMGTTHGHPGGGIGMGGGTTHGHR